MSRGALFLIFLVTFLCNYAGDIKRVKRAYEKSDFEKTEELILKSLADQSNNPGIKYYYSILFVTPEFQRFRIDSATLFIRWALEDFELADEDVLEEMNEEGILLGNLSDQLRKITRLAFERAKKESSVNAWQFFLKEYPDAEQYERVVYSRDSLAFIAVDKNSVNSLKTYKAAYPESEFIPETQQTIDRLLVNQFWNEKSIQDLDEFIKDNPKSEYRETAIRHLLKLWTISGQKKKFLNFISRYSNSLATAQAIDLLYHLDKEEGFGDLNEYVDLHPRSDSLRRLRASESNFRLAVFDKTYQFISNGEVTPTNLISTNEEVACSGVSSDLVSGIDSKGEVILTKSGTEFMRAELIRDLGAGFLIVKKDSKFHVYHKSGTKILDDVTDAEILNNQFIKVKREKWALYSLMGIALTEHRFDDIFVDGGFWFFRQDNLLAISSSEEIGSSFPAGLFLEFKFEDYELFDEELLIGFRGNRECLLKSNGKFLVPWGNHHIYPHHTNGYVRDEKGYAFYGPERLTYYPYLEVNEGFILRKEGEGQWMIFSNVRDWFLPLRDSVKLISKHCALITGQETRLLFQNQRTVAIDSTSIPRSLDLKMPFTLIQGDTSTIVNENGNILLSGNYDEVELLNDSLFSVSFEEMYGVFNKSGQELLPIQFDYLNLTAGMISFISDQKIGAYDLNLGVYFEPHFESKLEHFGYLYKTKKDGLFGLINREGEEVLPFIYEEISEWTDSLVWTQNKAVFSLVNINNQQTEMEVTLLKPFNAGTESLMKFYGSDGFGLINESGLLLKPIYSDIVWIGDQTQGVIMADQALPEAGFHVVTYFDSKGIKIHSQAYSNEDFEKVLCDR